MAKIKVKTPKTGCAFSKDQLQEIADNLEICCEPSDKCHKVWFAVKSPLNTHLPWQQLDDTGRPIGTIKYYTDGQWI